MEIKVNSKNSKDFIASLVNRILKKDIEVWIKDQEIENRIDWIDLDINQVIKNIQTKLKDYKHFDNYILLGMGGSSLSCLVYSKIFPNNNKLIVLDTINPDYIIKIEEKIKNKNNLFIVSSKSGTTIETDTLFKYFFKKYYKVNNFIFITDQRSPLDLYIKENYKDLVVLNPNENIGGRYSAFTEFGLSPAYLIDIDINIIPNVINKTKENILNLIDYELFENLISKLDKNYFELVFDYLPNSNKEYLGYWLEQLIAESTGKNNKGVLPIILKIQQLKSFPKFSDDFIKSVFKKSLKIYDLEKVDDIFSYMYLWFIQTSLIAALIKVNPFNQPDVKLSKDTTNNILKNKSNYNIEDYYINSSDTEHIKKNSIDFIGKVLKENNQINYIVIQYYGDYDEIEEEENLRYELMGIFEKPVILSLGPRYLHSIGQLYKGGPKSGVFIQILKLPKIKLSKESQELQELYDLFVYQALGDLLTTKKLNLPIMGFLK